jgi:uncharacterized repeat protein (TIGR03803 family)
MNHKFDEAAKEFAKPVVRAKNPFLVPVLVAGVCLGLADQSVAQTLTTIHVFGSFSTNSFGVYTNSDGEPGFLTPSGNALYGAGGGDGSTGMGTVYALNNDGTGFTVLHTFTATSGTGPFYGGIPTGTNSDGADPISLVLSGNALYGATEFGGTSGNGTVFKVNTDGTGFKILHDFSGLSDGANPFGTLFLSSNTLYGTTGTWPVFYSNSSGYGTVFKVNTDGTGFTTLYSFNGPPGVNGGVVLAGETLYGETGEPSGFVFAINTDGTGFTYLHEIFWPEGVGPAGLILSGNKLFGLNQEGATGQNTVFTLNTDGTGFTNLYSTPQPMSGLVVSGNTLYGDIFFSPYTPTVFTLRADGTGFRTLDNLTGKWVMTVSGNVLYGFAEDNSLFSFSVPPQLTLTSTGANVILSWPTNFTGYTLQSTPNLASPVWTTNLPAPVVVNGLNTVTNPISGTQQFFRLSQ